MTRIEEPHQLPCLWIRGRHPVTGYIHLALATGSPEAVDVLTERLRAGGYPVLDGPCWTGDGYYESVVQDPDGNRIEITV